MVFDVADAIYVTVSTVKGCDWDVLYRGGGATAKPTGGGDFFSGFGKPKARGGNDDFFGKKPPAPPRDGGDFFAGFGKPKARGNDDDFFGKNPAGSAAALSKYNQEVRASERVVKDKGGALGAKRRAEKAPLRRSIVPSPTNPSIVFVSCPLFSKVAKVLKALKQPPGEPMELGKGSLEASSLNSRVRELKRTVESFPSHLIPSAEFGAATTVLSLRKKVSASRV